MGRPPWQAGSYPRQQLPLQSIQIYVPILNRKRNRNHYRNRKKLEPYPDSPVSAGRERKWEMAHFRKLAPSFYL